MTIRKTRRTIMETPTKPRIANKKCQYQRQKSQKRLQRPLSPSQRCRWKMTKVPKMTKFQKKLTKKRRRPRLQNQSKSSRKQKTQPRIRKMMMTIQI